MPEEGILTGTYFARDQVPDCPDFTCAKNKLPSWEIIFYATSQYDKLEEISFGHITLLIDKYDTWKKEIQILEMATCVEKAKRALTVFLSLEGKAREAVLELDIVAVNFNDEKLDTLFLEDINQSAFWPTKLSEDIRDNLTHQ